MNDLEGLPDYRDCTVTDWPIPPWYGRCPNCGLWVEDKLHPPRLAVVAPLANSPSEGPVRGPWRVNEWPKHD